MSLVDWKHRHPDRVIATMAHELQHAVEVAHARDVVDAAGIRSLFREIGHVSARNGPTTTYETRAALRVTDDVLRELRQNPRAEQN